MFKKSVLIGIALSFSLTACGGSNMPTGADAPSMGSMSQTLTPMTAPGQDGGITPVNDLNPGDAYDQSVETPAEEVPAEEVVEEAPAEEVPAEATEAAPDVAADAGASAPGAMPEDTTVAEPYNPTTTTSSASSTPSYSVEGSFKVDQDTFNQWSAANIATDGVNIYVAAVDTKMPSKGTVISMDSSGGSWKDMGKSLLSTIFLGALGYKMSKTITGLALDSSGNVMVADAADRVYTLSSPKYSVTEVALPLSGATDVASAGDNFFIATANGIQKVDSSLSAPASFGSVTPTGGLGTDSQGNLYVVAGSSIKKLSASGSATQAVTGLGSPVDVAVDDQGNIFVLESSSVVWYNAQGVKQGEFGSGELTAPKAICTDSSGGVFVADAGADYKSSVVVKFSASSGGGGSLGESLGNLENL
ncbi:MAG: hypothetical protein ACAI44_00690 [Candidatus Sericytochromatia bacterium]